MFWYPDTAEGSNKQRYKYDGATADLDTNAKIKEFAKNIKNNENFNEGHLSRWQRTKESKQVCLFLPLSRIFGICKLNRVFIGVQHIFKFTPNTLNDMILTDTNANYKVEISHVSIFMPYVQPSMSLGVQLESLLSTNFETELFWEGVSTYRTELRDDKSFVWKVTT